VAPHQVALRQRAHGGLRAGLLGFEIAEWAWIGLQALEVVFGVFALAMLVLALASKTIRPPAREDHLGSSRNR
jgi:hypothetical protein